MRSVLRACAMVGVAAVPLASATSHAQDSCPSDMRALRVGSAVSCVPEDDNVVQAKDKLKSDPRFAALLKGRWDFIHPAKARPGEFCGAVFQTQDAMIWLMGPGGEYQGALLRFYGMDIPKPTNTDKAGMGKQRITLTQAPDPAQSLTVMNNAYKQFKFGVLSIPVPSMGALVGAIEDTQTFKIEIDGRVVFNSAWTDGARAREFLKKCAEGK
jgi:hypothetical protein